MDLVLKEGTVVLPWGEVVCDIGVRDGRIAALGRNLSGAVIRNCKGLHILPGLIDSQVHFREPGLTEKEDLDSGTRAAALGGITAICDMPNTKPLGTCARTMAEKFSLAQGRCHVDYGFYAGATPDNAADLPGLEAMPGVSGIKIFMGSSTGDLLVSEDRFLARALAHGHRRMAIHAEDEARLKQRAHLAAEHPRNHPVWRDEETAFLATRRIVALAEEAGRPLHILHITTAQELAFLAVHKRLVSVECLVQHLVLSAPECYERLGSYAQMNPPIRTEEHQEALWQAIADGVVDVVASDHAPHLHTEKQRPYPQSPSGMPGVQTLAPLMLWQVTAGRLSLLRLCQLMAENPARVLGMQGKGRICVGYDADFTLVDMGRKGEIQSNAMAYKCGWTPYDGMRGTAWPVATIVRGQIVMEDGALVTPGHGQPIPFLP